MLKMDSISVLSDSAHFSYAMHQNGIQTEQRTIFGRETGCNAMNATIRAIHQINVNAVMYSSERISDEN